MARRFVEVGLIHLLAIRAAYKNAGIVCGFAHDFTFVRPFYRASLSSRFILSVRYG
jgi:hypothetical protein